MKKILLFILLITTVLYAAISYERDHSGDYKAFYTTPTGESSPTAATTIQQDKISVTPYTEATATYTNVKSILIHARTGIDVRVAFGTYSTASAGNFDIISAGTRLKLDNLNISSLEVKLRGDDTATDTGVVSVIVEK